MRVGVVSRDDAFRASLAKELVEHDVCFEHRSFHALEFEGELCDIIIVDSPGPRELSTVLDSTPATLPLVVVVDEAAALPHPEELARASALLLRPFALRELEAAMVLALRGGSYSDNGASAAGSAADPTPPAASGGSPRQTRSTASLPLLTPRELEVLRRLADGWTNRGIGGSLGISENTVKFHLASIYRKLGAESRTEALIRAAQEGLIAL